MNQNWIMLIMSVLSCATSIGTVLGILYKVAKKLHEIKCQFGSFRTEVQEATTTKENEVQHLKDLTLELIHDNHQLKHELQLVYKQLLRVKEADSNEKKD